MLCFNAVTNVDLVMVVTTIRRRIEIERRRGEVES